MAHVVEAPARAGHPAANQRQRQSGGALVEEAAGDPLTVVVPDLGAIAAASYARVPAPPPPDEAIPHTLEKAVAPVRLPLGRPRRRHDLLAGATMAAALAAVLALLVVVAIVGIVGGLGLGIVLGNVAG